MILVCLLNEYYVGPRFIPTMLMYSFDIRASGATGEEEGTLQVLQHEEGFVGPAPLGTSTPPLIEISVCCLWKWLQMSLLSNHKLIPKS